MPPWVVAIVIVVVIASRLQWIRDYWKRRR